MYGSTDYYEIILYGSKDCYEAVPHGSVEYCETIIIWIGASEINDLDESVIAPHSKELKTLIMMSFPTAHEKNRDRDSVLCQTCVKNYIRQSSVQASC